MAKTKKKVIPSPILHCGCTRNTRDNSVHVSTAGADYQDRVYGPGKRLHTVGGKGIAYGTKATCTVCGTVRAMQQPKTEEPKEEGKKAGSNVAKSEILTVSGKPAKKDTDAKSRRKK